MLRRFHAHGMERIWRYDANDMDTKENGTQEVGGQVWDQTDDRQADPTGCKAERQTCLQPDPLLEPAVTKPDRNRKNRDVADDERDEGSRGHAALVPQECKLRREHERYNADEHGEKKQRRDFRP